MTLPLYCVVFMDEAGLPEEKMESLKVLHYYLDAHEVTKGAHDLDDLLRQLTGGRKDEGLALLPGHIDLLEDGDREGGSLTGT